MTPSNSDSLDREEAVSREVFPLPVQIYGHSACQETAQARQRLQEFQIPFVEIDIDQDESGRRFVERVNHGEQLTPTIVFGDQDFIIVQPTRAELDQALRRAGYGL